MKTSREPHVINRPEKYKRIALVSLIRYRKQRKIQSWDEFEDYLPEEPLSRYGAFANPVLTWEALVFT
jgi:hypothetical protein